ncbi:hypothetical protein [Spiroplasma ixodetis]|uniref:Transmembrane protein n=1 Tax=Spiroplasma ixodetis TaxID=2141 RepID=A0ABN6SZA9_9MOLU|nr:hypothetical protein [Spiroplasma ixodetis]BDT04338.1 hypothetical protein SHM_19840 [Spiroplasma ixodetis]BDT05200.1 hypothetical protein SHM_28460 [Spiroplasma ixodetis]
MTDKTKSQTYNFLSENKSIEDILKQENIFVKEIKKKRHGGKTYRIDNDNNQQLNDEQIQNIAENLEIVATSLTDNEKEQVNNNDIWTKFKNLLPTSISNTQEISKLQTIIQEKNKEIQQLKKENEELKQAKQSDVNLTKYTYNSVTIYDEKQRKKTGIEKIYEEILKINNKIYFITTIQNIDNSINEEIIHFYQLKNGDIQVVNQIKKYENMNKYKNDLSLIEDTSTNKNNIFFSKMPIKKFLSNQEESNLNITKSEWITFLAISIFSLCLLSVPAILTIYLPTIIVGATVGIIIAEKIGILALSTLVIGALDKVLWNLVSHKTKKIRTKTKNSIFWLLRKLPFCKNLDKNKEEKEIKNNNKKTIENLTNDKLETKLQTQYDILKQELDNRKDMKPDKLISNNKINHNSNSILENSSIESENNQNFDSSIRNTINHLNQQPSTSLNNNWNKVKCLLT